jgi:hypothetical protein
LRHRRVQIAALHGAEVAGDAGTGPAEIVGRADVGEERETELVTEIRTGVDEVLLLDDERRLAVGVDNSDEPRDVAVVAQLATSLIS